MVITYFLYGIIAGCFGNVLGIGASVFALPFLALLGVPYDVAIYSSLLAVLSSAMCATLKFYYTGEALPWRVCNPMFIPAALFALLGGFYITPIVSPLILKLIYAGLLFLNVDFLCFILKRKESHVFVNDIDHHRYFYLYIGVAVLAGIAAGTLGAGGGVLIVPFLIFFAKFSIKDALKVTAPIMVVTSFFGLFPAFFHSNMSFLSVGVPLAFGALIGGLFGVLSVPYVRSFMLRKISCIVYSLSAVIIILTALVFP